MEMHLQRKLESIVGIIKDEILLKDQGCTSTVSKLITDRGIYLLKSSVKEKYREWLRKEANLLKKLSSINIIPVPEYFGFIDQQDSSHLIMSFEEGITLTTALQNTKNIMEKKSLIRSFGEFLCQLHEKQIVEPFHHHNNWLEEQLMKAEEYLFRGESDGNAELLEKLKANKLHPVKQTIIHGDCTTDNVLVINGQVRLFIDLSGMTVGDPRYDESLAIRKFVKDEEYKQAFYQGYTRYRVSDKELQYFDEGLYEFF
ncbi:aminoglycoside phosphotransferase family protein [Bacillus sp. FJAT-49736]|uniref:aminoglycoside phosphotransferase family protein n=1 Tax=Bacillus sp. FJAT-49736 TaxID=2833582 RepID=UPI001BC91EE3|nr:aminoglycoside phosphotransferase family protein [Bacillus sp. FJAT-49736]MBS4172701.1 aminoglycoside phosphotransferase family protein [Bacillus sp. FJAT-49736]